MLRQQIIGLYELEGMSVEAIAELLAVELGIVRDVLSAASLLFQERVQNGREEDVTRDDMKEAFKRVKAVMVDDTAPKRDQLKAAMYIIDERKGRNDAKAGAVGMGHANVLMLNERLKLKRAMRRGPIQEAQMVPQQQLLAA